MSLYQPPSEHPNLSPTDGGLLEAVAAGAARLTVEQAMGLLKGAEMPTLGRWADARARTLHGDTFRTYIIDRNINYTNVCTAKCTFCAFRRDADDHDAYTLPTDAILEKIAELSDDRRHADPHARRHEPRPAARLLPQPAPLHQVPASRTSTCTASARPSSSSSSTSSIPPAQTFEDKVRWMMAKLKEAGLDSLPGGGGEIFAEPVRRKIGLGKCDAESLADLHVRRALARHVHERDDDVRPHRGTRRPHPPHEARPRVAGSRCAIGGDAPEAFRRTASEERPNPSGRVTGRSPAAGTTRPSSPGLSSARTRPWAREGLGRLTEPRRTRRGVPRRHASRARLTGARRTMGLSRPRPGAAEFGRRVRMAGATEYLRTQAISRLMLDNIYSIGSSWVTMGPHIGQVGSDIRRERHGLGDDGGERGLSAGTTYCLNEAVLCRLIRDAGFTRRSGTTPTTCCAPTPALRAPDLQVTDWSKHRARKMHQEAPKQPKVAVTISANK
jgi:cyclic dehypoxanthinyl futalosine synthase